MLENVAMRKVLSFEGICINSLPQTNKLDSNVYVSKRSMIKKIPR